MITKVLNFLVTNRKLLLIALLLLLGFILYNSFTSEYRETKKKLKALEVQIKKGEDSLAVVRAEKKKLEDSSKLYETAAQRAGKLAKSLEAKAEKERRAKEEALAKLKNLPVKVIDSILTARYADIDKSGIDLTIDKNVGNAVVEELVEKDYLADHVVTISVLNGTLKSQVSSLEKSLDYSKGALKLSDSSLIIRTRQYEQSQQSIELLKKDLKVAKRKAFWNQWKGVGAGIVAGALINLLAK